MTENAVYHALMLNLHQPAGNLEHLLTHQEPEARAILQAMARIPHALQDAPEAKVHFSLSGTLLETLQDPEFQQKAESILDGQAFLDQLRRLPNLEILGTAYYHPVLPLIPRADWEPQLEQWRRLARHWSPQRSSKGFWPPEMGFCMEMIPMLKRQGYEFVLVDSEHVQPLTPMGWETLRYRPHVARFGGDEIVVIVRDRELSNRMANGMTPDEFRYEARARTQDCEFTPLITTCCDGENGDWFRNPAPANFWDGLYRPLLEQLRAGAKEIQPVFIQEYLDRFGATGEVTVGAGAWNTGWHDGHGFMQWAGTPAQKSALNRVDEISQAVQAALGNAARSGADHPEWLNLLQEAHRRVLRAETSCNFFWGDAWVVRNRLAKPGWWSRQQGDGIPDDTIEAVCRDKWQFSCWWDSQKARVSTRTPAQLGLCYQAAQAVLDGIEDDPTGGADHYHTIAKPDYAKTWPPEWAKGHKGVVIGNHVFYRIGLRQ